MPLSLLAKNSLMKREPVKGNSLGAPGVGVSNSRKRGPPSGNLPKEISATCGPKVIESNISTVPPDKCDKPTASPPDPNFISTCKIPAAGSPSAQSKRWPPAGIVVALGSVAGICHFVRSAKSSVIYIPPISAGC